MEIGTYRTAYDLNELKRDPHLIRHVSHLTPEACSVVVMEDPTVIEHIPKELRTEDLLKLALLTDSSVVRLMDGKINDFQECEDLHCYF